MTKWELTPSRSLLILIVSTLVFGLTWKIQASMVGVRPEEGQTEHMNPAPPKLSPELEDLERRIAEHPEQLDLRRQFAQSLWSQLADAEKPDPGMVLTLVDNLAELLKAAPKDPAALLMMANIAFNQRVFDKAADYYKRYLETSPNDSPARASYASSLTFLSRFDDALKELDIVQKADPKNFQAAAYRAITLAEMGKTDEAVKAGKKALDLSPSVEARNRLSGFLDTLITAEAGEKTPPKDAPRGNQDVVGFIKSHPIAGPKFVKSSSDPQRGLLIFLRDFPMESMPPFVRDSFIGKIKEAAISMGKDSPSRVILIDEATNHEMAVVTVTAP